jgi:putative ABC transport system permease protein
VVAEHQPDRGLIVEAAWGPLKHVQRIVWWVELFVYLASAATLGLGGFGIYSGMLSTVRARTREIGLKKAMGAEDGDIMKQFLAESVSLGVAGGALGILAAWGGVALIVHLLHAGVPDRLFMIYGLGSIAFSLVLGAVAGYYPARQASRMEVVTAIRYE